MKNFLFWLVISLLALASVTNCAMEMSKGNWPTHALLAAVVIFMCGFCVGALALYKKPKPPFPKSCLVDVTMIGDEKVWRAEIWCPVCGTRHIDAPPFDRKVHKIHMCEQCGLLWCSHPIPTVGVAT